ncbi:MAG TPA: hypothetical protein VEE84_05630 [Burkholderiaceae bacterium]|nr:hypothetical protein [Burkholderiaceae bacterium]
MFRGLIKDGGLRVMRVGAMAALLGGASAAAEQPAMASNAPLAVVTDIKGDAALVHAGRRRGVLVLDLLERSDELLVSAKAQVELAFFSGAPRVFVLSGPGRFAVRADAVVSRDAAARIAVRDLAEAWRTVQIRPGMLGRASVALRGSSVRRLQAQAPIGVQLEEALDALRWNPPYGPDSQNWQYSVRLIDADGALVFSVSTRATEVALPTNLPWQREQPYLWTVKAVADDGRRAESATEFRLVDRFTQERIQQLAQIAQEARALQPQADGTAEQVLFAIALDQAGLRSEADRRWRALASVRPAFASFAAARPREP